MIRLAVIGAGHWGPNLIANFHDHRRSVVAKVVDRDAARLEAVKARFQDIEVGSDAEEVFRDDSVDAVAIATPTSTHFELARAALEAGKHVLVEKPIADTSEKAEKLCELAERAGRILMVGHVFVYNAAAQAAKECLAKQELGRVFYVSMVRTNLGPIRVDVNAAFDLAAHDISLANYWLDAQPLTASAVGGAWINGGIEDAVFATLRYPEQVLVNLHASWLNPRKAREITIVGDRRMLTFDDMNMSEPLRIYDKQVMEDRTEASFVDSFTSFRMSVREGDVLVPRVRMSEPLRTECEHFLDCVSSGDAPLSGGAEGLAVVRVLDAIASSLAQGGREIEVVSG
ncbi:MAG: Gfo/Idh/MocA family oxidoreductase [Deltaproteobacteria bacterium]|nr:Gfo/Idh/MocA family oxidoreductase [Deltaproteobacteria bacterium]